MDPFLGEIRLFSFQFVPKGWAACNGAVLLINQNTALFALLGVVYGGDGRVNFGLPDLKGRTPIHFGVGLSGTQYVMGEKAGSETVILNSSQVPSHTHQFVATSTVADKVAPGGPSTHFVLATAASDAALFYGSATALGAMDSSTIDSAGSAGPHANLQPSIALNPCIATSGVYPPRS